MLNYNSFSFLCPENTIIPVICTYYLSDFLTLCLFSLDAHILCSYSCFYPYLEHVYNTLVDALPVVSVAAVQHHIENHWQK